MITFCKFLCCAVVKIVAFNQMNDTYCLAFSYFSLPKQLFSSNSARLLLVSNAQTRKTPQGYLLKISCSEKLQPLKK